MEVLNESINELTSEAEEARSKLEEIGDSRKNLENLQDTLGDLTTGTEEWKNALLNVNSEVLALIEKYPFLADFVTSGKNGEMDFTDEGWDALYDKQAEIATNLMGLTFFQQAESREMANSILTDEFLIESGRLVS